MKFKKTIIIFIAFSCTAFASTAIDWTGGAVGGVRDENSSLTPVGLNSIWVLYFAGANDLIDPIDPFGSVNTSGGDDQILIVANNATSLGRLDNTDLPGGNSVQNFGSSAGEFVGDFYTRVFNFQDNSVDSSNPSTWNLTIPDGTYYYESPTFGPAPETEGVIPSPTPLNVFWDGSDSGISPQMTSQFSAIPEPSTFMLTVVALGAFFGMRRKFRS